MKKVILSATLLTSSLFAYQDVYQFLDTFNPTEYGRPMLGDVISADGNIIGQYSCSSDGDYILTMNLINTNSGVKNPSTIKVAAVGGKEVCTSLVIDKDKPVVETSITIKGKKYTLGADGYGFGNYNCRLIPVFSKRSNGEVVRYIYNACYGVDIENSLNLPEIIKYDKNKMTKEEYLRILIDTTTEWNKGHTSPLSGLWIDTREERKRYSQAEIIEFVKKATYVGDYTDGEGNYLFTVTVGGNNVAGLIIGDTFYKIDFDITDELKENINKFISNRNKTKHKYFYKCGYSADVPGVKPTLVGYIVEERDGIEVRKRLIANRGSMTGNRYTCSTTLHGMEVPETIAIPSMLYTRATFIPPFPRYQ